MAKLGQETITFVPVEKDVAVVKTAALVDIVARTVAKMSCKSDSGIDRIDEDHDEGRGVDQSINGRANTG